MRIIKFFIVLTFLGLNVDSEAQEGYLGRRHTLKFSFLGNIPLLSGSFFETNYYDVNGTMTEKRDWLDYGVQFDYNYVVGKRSAIGIEFTNRRFEVFADQQFRSSFYDKLVGNFDRNIGLRIEPAGLNYVAIIPQIILSPKKSYSGTGISHVIGIGYSFTQIRKKEYAYSLNEFYSEDSLSTSWTPSDNYYLDHDWKAFKAITIMYALNIDVPITDLIHFSAGFSYYINLHIKPTEEEMIANKKDFFIYEDLFYNVQRENLFNLNLNFGIAFVI